LRGARTSSRSQGLRCWADEYAPGGPSRLPSPDRPR
jgi:hypothetical protein